MEHTKLKIVCIEDEEEMIDLIKLVLGRRGYEVLGADGGQNGLALVRETLPAAILLDLMMPEMDGWEVFRQLKSDPATRDIPVIVVTAKAQTIEKVFGLHVAKVSDYITKPFSPTELIEHVEKVLYPSAA